MEATNFVVIGREQLWRELLASHMQTAFSDQAHCVAFDFESVLEQPLPEGTILILLEFGHEGRDILEDVEVLHATFASSPIAVISDCLERGVMLRALSLGVKGYLSTATELRSLVPTLEILRIGGEVMSPALLIGKTEGAQTPTGNDAPARRHRPVTEKEHEVLSLLRMGKPNKVIAAQLELDEAVVKNYIRNLMRKTGTHNRVQLALSARDLEN